ncbi:MAG: protein kinase [Acidobacteria bacterium]|nr:protein kinase [Acidobacteriota bacterium]
MLSPGTRLGVYEIQAALGAGGMGEVYRARDTKLARDVAIKVLPASVVSDPERIARFEREAQLLAALNHPHIAAIYGLEGSDASQFLVMELVDGDTLAERLKTGPIHVAEALAIARQIADALQAAHEKGIVHRDLKPANIALTAGGQVKVLDFGLAKALGPAEAGPAGTPVLTNSPTLTVAATQAGVILGTAAYMAPEQARGKPVDKRADIWAFGCVLCEMLTGKRAFEGEDLSETLAFVLTKEPDWRALSASTPASVLALLRRCLERDVRKRVADASTLLFVLDEATAPGASDRAEPERRAAVANRPGWRRVAPAGAAAVGAALLAGAGVWWTMRPAPPRVVRTEIVTTGERALSIQGADRDVAITPDGSRIIYRGDNQLLVRALDQIEPHVFVSPDGQWLGFVDTVSTLKKVAIAGGPAVTIAQMDGAARGATWLPDDTVIFATGALTTGLQRVSAAGGEPMVLTKPDRERGEGDHMWPELLPGGQAVLFTITPTRGGLDNAQIAVLDIATGVYKVLVRGGHHAHYVPTGHLVYGASGTLRAVPFDLDSRQIVGTPVPVLEGVATTLPGAVDVSVAANGTMVYLPGRVGSLLAFSPVWVDRMGREEPIGVPPRPYAYARLSPDGTRIALDVRGEQNDIWLWDLIRKTMTRLTFDPGNNRGPVWSPDGRRMAFTAERDGGETIYWQASDGTGAPERLTQGPVVQVPNSFSPDGRRLIFNQPDAPPYDLGVVTLEGERRAALILRAPYNEVNGEISPDGRWLAYQSNESGRDEIYVRPFPNVDAGRWQVSTDGGTRPVWSRNGRELFYFVVPGTLIAVPVQLGTGFSAGTPQVVFKGAYGSVFAARHYDVSPDGRRFLMLKTAQATDDATSFRSLVVVQNWTEELKRLVPAN